VGRPRTWPLIVNPLRPSWGEPFVQVAARVHAAMHDAWAAAPNGEVVMVSHQMPIWMVARHAAGKSFAHDPRKRRCTLSSITSFDLSHGEFVEVSYQEPARDLLATSVDLGAV
jgi:broad specificity phosphatase PhoE